MMRALWGKIREHEIELVNNGDKEYSKNMGEEKWREPGAVIGKDGKKW